MKANQSFKENDNAVSPVIGVILMVAITVVLAAVVFVLVSSLTEDSGATPQVTFTTKGSGNSTVATVQGTGGDVVAWIDFTPVFSDSGCSVDGGLPTTGNVTAGEAIRFTGGDCANQVFSLVYTPTNEVAGRVNL